MALGTFPTKTGYYVAKFEDTKANVFIYRDGYLGIRNRISINEGQRHAAEADLAIVNERILAASHIYDPINLGNANPDWVRLFTAAPQDQRFFNTYTWYSYQNRETAHEILLELAPLWQNPAA
jgi:hypothetical protein